MSLDHKLLSTTYKVEGLLVGNKVRHIKLEASVVVVAAAAVLATSLRTREAGDHDFLFAISRTQMAQILVDMKMQSIE